MDGSVSLQYFRIFKDPPGVLQYSTWLSSWGIERYSENVREKRDGGRRVDKSLGIINLLVLYTDCLSIIGNSGKCFIILAL